MPFITAVKAVLGFEKLTGRQRKSIGEWCLLLSVIFIVPLMVVNGLFSPAGKIIMQFLWAVFMVRGAFLVKNPG